MSTVRTHYQNLHIEQTATPAEIRVAYKSLCQKYHPDKHQDAQTLKIFNMINTAYRVLSDPDKRVKHDRWIREQNKKNKTNVEKQEKKPNPIPVSRHDHAQLFKKVSSASHPENNINPKVTSVWFGNSKKFILIILLLSFIFLGFFNKTMLEHMERARINLTKLAVNLYQQHFAKPTSKSLLELAQSGNSLAQFQLGQMYFSGSGVEIDPTKAALWIKRAAKQQNPTAQWALAYCYQYGYGLKKNFQKAHYWYKKSALKGFAEAQYSLGLQYLTGRGTKQDDAQAAIWLKQAAKKDNLQAKYYLAFLYQHGRGLKKDKNLAIYWYKKAAEQGDFKSVQALVEMGVL